MLLAVEGRTILMVDLTSAFIEFLGKLSIDVVLM